MKERTKAKVKKLCALALVGCISISTLTGCGSGSESGSDDFVTGIQKPLKKIPAGLTVKEGLPEGLYLHQDFPAHDAENLTYAWGKIPEQYQKLFLDTGWKIAVTELDLEEYYGVDYMVESAIDAKEKVVYVDGHGTVDAVDLLAAMGVVIEKYHGSPSSTEEFLDIYEDEWKWYKNTILFYSEYFKTPEDYFSLVFAFSILKPEEVDNIPRTEEYMDTYFKSLELEKQEHAE